MPPKGGNAKKEAGRAKKAENEGKKKEAVAADKERKEAASWEDGARTAGKREAAEEKRKADLARKAEKARLLAEEEAALPSKPKAAPKAGDSKKRGATLPPAGPGALAAGGLAIGGPADDGKGKGKEKQPGDAQDGEPESFAATGLDDALALLSIVNAKTDAASVGTQAAGIERHPERRFKAAFEAYQERELPKVREEHPGLRLGQYRDLMYKNFQKSPDNPFNQTLVSYDATQAERVEALRTKNEEVADRLRDRRGRGNRNVQEESD